VARLRVGLEKLVAQQGLQFGRMIFRRNGDHDDLEEADLVADAHPAGLLGSPQKLP